MKMKSDIDKFKIGKRVRFCTKEELNQKREMAQALNPNIYLTSIDRWIKEMQILKGYIKQPMIIKSISKRRMLNGAKVKVFISDTQYLTSLYLMPLNRSTNK